MTRGPAPASWLFALAAVCWPAAARADEPAAEVDPMEACLQAPERCPGAFPPPPPTGVFRAFSLTIAGGPGVLVGPGEQAAALSHNLLRFGWGLARNLSVYVSLEGVRAPSISPATHRSSWLRHDTVSLGAQYYYVPRVYVRGGLGVAWVGEKTGDLDLDGGTGLAGIAAVGVDLVQLPRSAVSLEIAGTTARYATEWWGSTALNLALTLF
jgi:hypothetical protein